MTKSTYKRKSLIAGLPTVSWDKFMMIVVGSMAVAWQARGRITGVSSYLICKWRKKKNGERERMNE